MTRPKMIKWFCPCGGTFYRNGKTKKGTQRYRCGKCHESPKTEQVGRPPINGNPMTGAERQAKYRHKDD